jgi:Leucine-rich repeat (LRR) protein
MVTGAFSCAAVTEIPQSECEALVALYNSTNGDSWTDRTGWLQTLTPCSWTNVVCQGGSVTKIYLANNNLTGSLPSELGDLSNLTNFEPWGNQIGGSIPAALGSLANMQQIWMPANAFTGPIPPELGNLGQLRVLNLGGSQLTGPVPAELGNATSLTQLHLWNNDLTGEIPASLGSLTSLQYFNLEGNDLVGSIPAQLSTLTNLVQFRLSNNQLSGVVPFGVAQVGASAQPDCDFRSNSGLYMPATPEYTALGDPLCRIALTPLAGIGTQVTTQLSNLIAAGSINGGIGNALMSRFLNALQKLNGGNTQAAQGMLAGIISQIVDLIDDGEISASDGNNLIALAEALTP